jgi:hypothetical protein
MRGQVCAQTCGEPVQAWCELRWAEASAIPWATCPVYHYPTASATAAAPAPAADLRWLVSVLLNRQLWPLVKGHSRRRRVLIPQIHQSQVQTAVMVPAMTLVPQKAVQGYLRTAPAVKEQVVAEVLEVVGLPYLGLTP